MEGYRTCRFQPCGCWIRTFRRMLVGGPSGHRCRASHYRSRTLQGKTIRRPNVFKQVGVSSLVSICWRTASMTQSYCILHSNLCSCYLSDGFTVAFLVDWHRITLCASGRTTVGLALFCTRGRVTLVGTGVKRTSI